MESVSPCLFWGQKVPFLVVQVQSVGPTSAAPLEHPASRVGEDVCSPVSRHSLSYLLGLSRRITAPKMSVFSVLELLMMPHACVKQLCRAIKGLELEALLDYLGSKIRVSKEPWLQKRSKGGAKYHEEVIDIGQDEDSFCPMAQK